MTNPISSLDAPQIQTTATEVPQFQPEMSREEFGARVFGVLDEGYKNGYDADYVTGQLQQLSSENPSLAKQAGFPTDNVGIKTRVVQPYNDSQKLPEKEESDAVSLVKKGWNRYYDWAQAKDKCLQENVGTFIDEGIECATTAAVAVSGKVPKAVGIASAVKECVDVVKPFIECHINPDKAD